MKPCIRVAAALALSLGLAASRHAQAADLAEPTPEQWRADLSYLWEQLDEVHPDPFHHVSREELKSAFDALSDRVEQLERHEVIVGIAQLLARLGTGDGHSELWIAPTNARVGFQHLPVGFYRFEDGFRVQTARDDFRHLLGAKVLRLGTQPAEEAFARVATATSADNPSQASAYVTLLMSVPEILHGVGVTESPMDASIVVETEYGESITERLPAGPPQGHLYLWQIEPTLPTVGWGTARDTDRPTPLYLRSPEVPLWMEYEPGSQLLYVQLDEIRDPPGETLAAFYDRVFDRAEQEDAGYLVIDVRQNGGGNNQLNRQLIHHLIRSTRFREHGRLFLIIGRHTFSAASHLVTYIESNTDAILVGEPTGGTPNHYGDVDNVLLPSSGLSVGVSAYFWQNSLPWDRRPWTPPDVETPLRFEEYRDGLDPAMAAIRAMIAGDKPLPPRR